MKEARHKASYNLRFHLYEISRIDKSMEIESILAVDEGLGAGGEWKRNCLMRVVVMFGNLIEVMVVQHCDCTKCH